MPSGYTGISFRSDRPYIWYIEGGVQPYSYTKISGPDWLSANGESMGTRGAVGSNPDLVVKVTDKEGRELIMTIPVGDTIPQPVIDWSSIHWEGTTACWDPVPGATSYAIRLNTTDNSVYNLDGSAPPTHNETSHDCSYLLTNYGEHPYVFNLSAKINGVWFTSPQSPVMCFHKGEKTATKKNIVKASFEADGSYRNSVTCNDCGYELPESTDVVIPKATASFKNSVLIYNGEAQLPEPVVKDGNGKVLVAGTDYSWSLISAGESKEPGSYKIRFTFTSGYYEGNTDVWYQITEKAYLGEIQNIQWNGNVVSWNPVENAESYTVEIYADESFSSENLVDTVNVTSGNSFDISSKLKEGQHKYAVKISASAELYNTTGKYESQWTEEICKHEWSTSTTAPNWMQNGSEVSVCSACGMENTAILPGWSTSYVKSFKISKGKGYFTAKWKKQSKKKRKQFNGYQLRYSTDPSMADARYVNLKNTKKSYKVKKLQRKTRYYVQLRTHTNGFYSPWSTKTVVTK